jgi:hypothetical protein
MNYPKYGYGHPGNMQYDINERDVYEVVVDFNYQNPDRDRKELEWAAFALAHQQSLEFDNHYYRVDKIHTSYNSDQHRECVIVFWKGNIIWKKEN